MSSAVLDASAILAFVYGEPGAERVRPHVGTAIASAVNIAEASARLCDNGLSMPETRRVLGALYLEVAAFDAKLAYASTAIRTVTRSKGLSLGDRACLALSLESRLPALTADRAWQSIEIGADVELIRNQTQV